MRVFPPCHPFPRRKRSGCRWSRTFALVSALCFALALPVRSQETDIRGVVGDSTNGQRLVAATVSVHGTSKGGVTNANGFYVIPKVPAGSYDIVASCVGYERQQIHVIIKGDAALTVNFRLAPRDVEVSEVVIQGNRSSDTSHIATSVYSILPRELQRVPTPGSGDVFRSVTILPGIVSTADVSSKFYVRGGASDQNLILFDGMRIYNPYHAFGIFSVFDNEIIRGVDMYTGAFPAGYWGRLSSVMSISTRNGNASRLSGGANLNFISSRVRLEGPMGQDNSFIVSGQKSIFGQSLGPFLKDPPPVSFYDIYAKGTISSPTGLLSLRGFLSGDDVRSNNLQEADHVWRNQGFAASFSNLIADRLYLDATASFSRSEIRRDPKLSNTVLPASSSISEFGVRSEFTSYTESQNLWYGGFEVTFPQTEYDFSTRGAVEQNVSSIHPEFCLWIRREQRLGRLRADLGVQADLALMFEKAPTFQSLQPRITAVFDIADHWRAKASFGIYTQNNIGITNEDDVISLFEAWIYLPDRLRPEEAHHSVFGLEADISSVVAAKLQSYYKSYRSIALYNREKVFASDPDYVTGTGESYGIESLVRFASPTVDLYLAYTLGWATLTTGAFTYPPRYDRRHSLNLMGVFRPLGNVDLTLRWEFGSGYPFSQNAGRYDRLTFPMIVQNNFYQQTGEPYSTLGPKNGARLPAYHRLDASLTYRFSLESVRGTAGIYIINVYNRKNVFYFDRKTGQIIDMLSFFPSATISLEF